MLETSARLLRLLSLLQSRRDWPGAELAERLGVTTRTVRRDVDRLRDLGYPVESATGTRGGYRLGAGAALPPLLLDDDEAVAVAVGLRAATGTVTGIEETSLRALAKLEQVLPSRLRHRVDAMRSAILPLTGPGPTVDPDLLLALAAACRAHEGVRFGYQQRTRRVEPYRLVHTGRRWYLLAFDLDRDDWRTFRVDRMDPAPPRPGPRFTPRPEPAEGAHAYVANALTAAPYRYQATILFHAPLQVVAEHTSPTSGRLEPRDADSCLFHAGGDSLDKIALYVALKGIDFQVLNPPELRDHIRALARRLGDAASATELAGAGGRES
ncbi:YafY family protein [Parafrankia sp. EUN1f]|uniref:helix-turn-helix transcriptional regulator n=1 Tax=Parafrankia sp. EUN1f TaxID=102897 RepID=UPI0001C43978|nr:WYL domain-containing protein [Parafrankia sp. EUN1f]EFC85927.1 Helix-turn-helix type 11 domain protein [Parafrankia sp. EUN1f]